MVRITPSQPAFGSFQSSLPTVPSDSEALGRKGGPLRGLPSELPNASQRLETESVSSFPNAPTEDVELDDLVATRARLVRGLNLLQQHRGTDQEDALVERLVSVATRDYAPQVAAIRERVGLDDLREMQVGLAQRLDRGYAMPDEDRIVSHFADLLLRYEAITDVLMGDTTDALLQRVQCWQTREDEA